MMLTLYFYLAMKNIDWKHIHDPHVIYIIALPTPSIHTLLVHIMLQAEEFIFQMLCLINCLHFSLCLFHSTAWYMNQNTPMLQLIYIYFI